MITAALPYVNNVPHIGNIVGSHLPADIFARYQRTKGNIVLFVGGTDEHGTPIEVEAIKSKTTPEKLVEFYNSTHRKIYEWFNISYDNFSQTSKSQIHRNLVQEIFLRLYANGYVVEKEEELPYDPKMNKFLPDRYVIGKCPYCGYEKARGDQCENCGRLLNPKDLIEPRNAITGEPIEFRKSRHLYIDLKKFENYIKEWILSKRNIFTDQAINLSLGWINEGLRERSITRDIKWGIPVPYKELWQITLDKIFKNLDFGSKDKFEYSLVNSLKSLNLVFPEDEYLRLKEIIERNWPNVGKILEEYNYFEIYKDKVFYVWFDALIGYISFTIEKLKENYRIEELNVPSGELNGNIVKVFDKEYKVNYEIKEGKIYIKEIFPIDKNVEIVIKTLLEKAGFKEAILEENWRIFWSDKSKIYHFIGKDNIPFHTVFWPALLMGSNNVDSNYKKYFGISDLFNFNLPYNVVGLSYLVYYGKKISKSQNWGVFTDSLLDTELDSDYWRFYLSYLIPENKDTSFSWDEFKEVINKELVNNIGNLTHRVLSFSYKKYKVLNSECDIEVINKVEKYLEEYKNLMDNAHLPLALRKILEFSNYGNSIFQERKPWENEDERFIKSMLILIITLYTMLYPFIPSYSEKILNSLGIKEISFDKINEIIENCDKIEIKISEEPKPLFKKLDDETINKLKEITTKPKYIFTDGI